MSAYLNEKLTGRWVTSASSGDSMGLMDLRTREWSDPLCGIAGVTPSQLPEIIAPGSVIGALSAALVAGYASPEYLWSRRYRTVLDAPGQGYLLETFTQSGTYLISWFVDTFSPSLLADTDTGEVAREADLENRSAAIAPGCDGLVALLYWNGAQTPYWDGDARGAVLG